MSQKLNNRSFLHALLKQPEEVIDKLDLVYLTSEQLAISRERNTKNFHYIYDGRVVRTKAEIERINKLVIPPA